MAKIKRTRAPKKRNTIASDDTYYSVLNLSTEETDEISPKMYKEGTREDANIDSGPTGGHDGNVSSDSSVSGDQRGWGRGGGCGGGNGNHPATTIDPSADSILKLFKHLGIEQKCDAGIINVEQFMSTSDLVSLDNRHIKSICAVNRKGERHPKTYISGKLENNLKLAAFATKHLKNTGCSCDPASVYKTYVMLFKDQKRRVETHQRDKITAPVLKNSMLDKEPEHTWDLIDENLSCVRDDNVIPISACTRVTAKLIPKPDSEDPATDYVTFDRKLIERAPIIQKKGYKSPGRRSPILD